MATIETDDYGQVPRALYNRLKKLNVSPSDWQDIYDAYYLVAQTPVNFAQARRFIEAHSTGGMYRSPWPFNPVDVVTA